LEFLPFLVFLEAAPGFEPGNNGFAVVSLGFMVFYTVLELLILLDLEHLFSCLVL